MIIRDTSRKGLKVSAERLLFLTANTYWPRRRRSGRVIIRSWLFARRHAIPLRVKIRRVFLPLPALLCTSPPRCVRPSQHRGLVCEVDEQQERKEERRERACHRVDVWPVLFRDGSDRARGGPSFLDEIARKRRGRARCARVKRKRALGEGENVASP